MSEFCALDWGFHFNPLLIPNVSIPDKIDKKALIKNLRLFAESRDYIGSYCF